MMAASFEHPVLGAVHPSDSGEWFIENLVLPWMPFDIPKITISDNDESIEPNEYQIKNLIDLASISVTYRESFEQWVAEEYRKVRDDYLLNPGDHVVVEELVELGSAAEVWDVLCGISGGWVEADGSEVSIEFSVRFDPHHTFDVYFSDGKPIRVLMG